jgi:TP901-1 family phage major tail protein|tara:strand:- start:4756 stop:5169 length:414 start_codon:yes stop_codon:yes gene_type:complete
MAVQKGSAVLMKIGNSASPEVFTTIGALRSTSITINSEQIDITNKDSSRNRTLLAGAGIKSFSVSGSGIFDDSASHQSVLTAFQGATFINFQFLVPDYNTFTGAFQVTSIEYSGEYNDSAQYSLSFESAGAVTIATV